MMLIADYQVKQIAGGCGEDGQTVSIQADLPADISAIFPYLNARLPGCVYNPAGQMLHWHEREHKIVLRPRTLAISSLVDWPAAKTAIGRLVQRLNQVWQEREGCAARDEMWPQPTPLAVYKLLPNTNCRLCGQPTCYTFALKLIAREATLDACTPLAEFERVGQRAELAEMLMPPLAFLFPTNGHEG